MHPNCLKMLSPPDAGGDMASIFPSGSALITDFHIGQLMLVYLNGASVFDITCFLLTAVFFVFCGSTISSFWFSLIDTIVSSLCPASLLNDGAPQLCPQASLLPYILPLNASNHVFNFHLCGKNSFICLASPEYSAGSIKQWPTHIRDLINICWMCEHLSILHVISISSFHSASLFLLSYRCT